MLLWLRQLPRGAWGREGGRRITTEERWLFCLCDRARAEEGMQQRESADSHRSLTRLQYSITHDTKINTHLSRTFPFCSSKMHWSASRIPKVVSTRRAWCSS